MIPSRYVKSSSSFGSMTVSRLSLIRIYPFPHSFRISLSVLNMVLYLFYDFSRYFFHSLFANSRYPKIFSVHTNDKVLLCLPPRYTLRNHHSKDIRGNLSGILLRFFRFFLPSGHKARLSFLLPPPLFRTPRYRSASATFFTFCKYIMMRFIRIENVLF